MRFISLFSGIGGFDLGFERAGMTCVAQVENNRNALAVLAQHWPGVERFEDVRDAGRQNLPAADLICGGFPCQDVSVAGNRAGLAGSRSGLWYEFLRILTELTPRWVVIENVPGLLSSNEGEDFAVILHGLVECGYGVCWRILDAQHFGVAQRRRRVFIVGSLGNGRSAEILFEREGGAGHSQPGGAARERLTAGVIKGASIGREPENGPQYGDWRTDDLSFTLNASEVHAVAFAEQRSEKFRDASVDATLASRDAKGVRTLIAGTLSASGAGTSRTGNSRNEADMLVTAFQQNQREEVRDLGDQVGALASQPGAHQQNYLAVDVQQITSKTNRSTPRRQSPSLTTNSDVIAFNWAASHHQSLTPSEVAPTIKSQHNGSPAIQNQAGVRRLTPTECERLQGFPDGWTAGHSDSARYQRLGNAVCVNVTKWLGKRLMEVSS